VEETASDYSMKPTFRTVYLSINDRVDDYLFKVNQRGEDWQL
jgi:hypothetical protein